MNILDIFLFSQWKITYMTILRYKNSFKHELELKCVKFSKTPHPRGSNDNIYNSRLPDLELLFLLFYIRKRNNWSHGKHKIRNLKRRNRHS